MADANEIVETCWGPKPIYSTRYWHLVGTPWLFYSNVRAGKGALLSVSAGIEAEPQIENAHTPYSLVRLSDEKERVFEEIRLSRYPHRPPRLKALYVFDDYTLIERAVKEWFPNEPKTVQECRILVGSVTHKADTSWLNSLPDNWAVNAEMYWKGQMSDAAFPEILVHGALFFPEWKSFPSV